MIFWSLPPSGGGAFLFLDVSLGEYMEITRSQLPWNNGNLPLPYFGGN